MGDSLRISVVIPCYGVASWLLDCLNEVLAALPPDAEVLAVDDGSSDETREILAGKSRADNRLKALSISHAGVSAARNWALDAARGRYVFFVDADDGVEPDFFSAMEEALERDSADCCICGYKVYRENPDETQLVGLKGDYRFRSQKEIAADFLPRIFGYSFEDVRAWYRGVPLFERREMAYSWRMAFRRSVIERTRVRFDENLELNEDAMFNAEFLLAATSMTCVDRPLYRTVRRRNGAVGTIFRDGLRYCRNKLNLLRKREELNLRMGGALTDVYAASNVLSALEIAFCLVRRRIAFAEGVRILREYLATPSVRTAFAGFPLSVRRPVLMAAVLFVRLFCPPRRGRNA